MWGIAFGLGLVALVCFMAFAFMPGWLALMLLGAFIALAVS